MCGALAPAAPAQYLQSWGGGPPAALGPCAHPLAPGNLTAGAAAGQGTPVHDVKMGYGADASNDWAAAWERWAQPCTWPR